jgi:hypothetical protein
MVGQAYHLFGMKFAFLGWLANGKGLETGKNLGCRFASIAVCSLYMPNLNTRENGFSLRDRNARRAVPSFGRLFLPSGCFCLILMALWVPTAARAATYYVDYASGSDTNNGTSTASAWKHCPGDYAIADVASTAVPSKNQLHSGDTVVFKGGVTYSIVPSGWRNIFYTWNTNGGIVINNSGTPGGVITYDGTGNSWGTGRAVIDGNCMPYGVAITFESGVSYFTLTGFEIRNFGGYPDTATNVLSAAAGNYTNTANTGGSAINCGNNTNLTFANLLVDRIGQWRNTIGWDGTSVSGNAIMATSEYGLTVTNCEITKAGLTALGMYAQPNLLNCLVTDCYFHDNIRWAMDVADDGAGSAVNGLTITKTRLLNLNAFGGEFQGPDGDMLHQNYIFLRVMGAGSFWTNVFVTRCLFGDTNSTLGGSGGTGAIFLSQGPSVNIYNNVFAHYWSIDGAVAVGYFTITTNVQVIRLFNNTFYHDSSPCLTMSQDTNRQVYVLNNLFTTTPLLTSKIGVDINIDPGCYPKVMDYDVYYSPNFTEQTRYVGAYYTLAYLQTNLEYEAHGFWANPVFNSPAPPTLDCTIATNSPVIGTGTNLSAYFTTDYAGNPRPTTGNWTIGAYEVPGTNQPAAGPRVQLRSSFLTITNGGSCTLSWTSVNATNLTISELGSVPLNGAVNVSPSGSTTYTATASGPLGQASSSVSIVTPPGNLRVISGQH